MKMTLVRDVKSPTRATHGSAGIDFYIPNDISPLVINPGESILIPSGVKVELEKNTVLIAHNKSSIAKNGLLVGASIIDFDYEGEIHINLWNVSNDTIVINNGQKIIQFIHQDYLTYPILIVLENEMYINSKSERGIGGFGSTNDKEIKSINLNHSDFDIEEFDKLMRDI